jgi:putative membrane protein
VSSVLDAPLTALPARGVDADSRARTHLANVRTFLAWLRTGLSLIAVGLAAAGFLPIDLWPGFPLVRVLAALLVSGGTLMTLYGVYSYVQACRQIDEGAYRPAVKPMVLIGAIVTVLGLMAIPLVVLLR